MSINPATTMVKVTNNSSEPLELHENHNVYILEVGTPQFIPYSAVVAHFGDPLAIDISAEEAFRRAELERMKVRWGLYHHGDIRRDFPDIICEDIDGNRLWTVIEDPIGENAKPPTPATEVASSNEAIAIQQREIQRLQAQVAAMQNATSETGDEELLDAAPEEFPVVPPVEGQETEVVDVEHEEDSVFEETPRRRFGLRSRVDAPAGS